MPNLVSPAIKSGSLSDMLQPVVPVERVAVLRPWALEDAAAVVEAFRDPAIQRWHVRRADSTDEAREWISHWRGGWLDESECHWAVADPGTDGLLGRIALKGLDLQDGTADLAYWMVPAARGRGLCVRSVIALCDWAFRSARFHRIEVEHSMDNAASCRVAVKAGFREEGIRRGAARHEDGWHDMHVHALLASDQTGTRDARYLR